MRILFLLLVIVIADASHARGGSVIAAGGQWAALLRDGRCDAETRIVSKGPAGTVPAIAGFTFDPDRRPWGQFRARLSRLPRPGASVIASVAGRQFLLASQGRYAWGRNGGQDWELIAAVRSGGRLRIQSRDRSGRRFTDDFRLDFAPTAIDAAAARCALLGTGQKR